MDWIGRYREPEYRRLLAQARRSLERTGGDLSRSVTVRAPDAAERKAIIGIIGYRDPQAKAITVRLSELDDVVRTGTGLSLAELLGEIGETVRDRPAEAAASARARTDLLHVAASSPLAESAPWYRDWLAYLQKGTLTRLLTRGEEHRLAQAVTVIELLEAGLADPLTLPELADRVAGDTKVLDNGALLAKLVLRALTIRLGRDMPVSAEQHRGLWDAFGVASDDLASRVLLLNLPADGDGLGEWLRGAARHGTPFQVTLHQLRTLPITTSHPAVFVCENPAVLRRAADRLGPGSAPLLCTEGLPSSAFHLLAQTITGGGGELRYHGDFDWPGVAIADAVMKRHGATPWRMSAADYRAGLRGNERPLGGRARPTPWAPDLGRAMRETGVVVNEEAVVGALVADLAVT